MQSLFVRRRAITATLVVLAVVLVAAYTANAVLRPDCSLLPVAVPDDGSGRSQPASAEQACAVLGRPLPHATVLPDGVRETTTAISTGAPAGIPRMVTVGYSKDGRGVALLEIARTGPPAGNFRANDTVAGAPAIVRQTHLQSIDADDVSFHWFRDDLMFTLHVQLAPGITRQAADAMAASIR